MLKIKDSYELVDLKKFGFVYNSLSLFGKGWYLCDFFKNELIKIDSTTRYISLYSHNVTVLNILFELFEFGFIERC